MRKIMDIRKWRDQLWYTMEGRPLTQFEAGQYNALCWVLKEKVKL